MQKPKYKSNINLISDQFQVGARQNEVGAKQNDGEDWTFGEEDFKSMNLKLPTVPNFDELYCILCSWFRLFFCK